MPAFAGMTAGETILLSMLHVRIIRLAVQQGSEQV
jgi:hypothetical protein